MLDLLSYNAGNPLRWPQGCRGKRVYQAKRVSKQAGKWGRKRMGEEFGRPCAACIWAGRGTSK